MAGETADLSEQIINLRSRSDLIEKESVFLGESAWIIKDPLSLKYIHLKPPEYHVLKSMDGTSTYTSLRKSLAHRFPELEPTKQDLQSLILNLNANGLLTSESSSLSTQLRQRRQRDRTLKFIQTITNVITIRFPGFSPAPLLNVLYPFTWWLFTRVFTTFACILFFSALLLVLINFELFYTRLPALEQFFGIGNLAYMGCLLVFTKSIHELGHGLMCRHFRGECNEIGFMLLVFTPAMYCDTSDSWTLSNKWHRIAIAAGGMYFEMILAALATFTWWFTHPNWLHYFSLNLVFLCSVSTVMFNANPLLRYDGYYILSDWLEIPNLSEKARLSLLSFLRVRCLGLEPIPARMLPGAHHIAFAIFSVASAFYRWFVLCSILWAVCEILEPFGMRFVAHLMVATTVAGSIGWPAVQLVRYFSFPGRLRLVSKYRFITTLALLFLIGIFISTSPLPFHVEAPFVLLPNEAQKVFVTQPGRVIEIRAFPGDRVDRGDVIAVLENHEVITEINRLKFQIARHEADLESYQLLQGSLPSADRMIGQLLAQLAQSSKQLQIREQQLSQLTLKADRAGYVVPPPNMPSLVGETHLLDTFFGTAFDPVNRNAYLPTQTLFCYVGRPDNLKAFLTMEEQVADLVRPGQNVTFLMHQYRYRRFASQIESVSSNELETLPRELSQTNHGWIPAETQLDGSERPLARMYEAEAVFPADADFPVYPNFFGLARIRVDDATVSWRVYRYFSSLFKF